MTYSESTDAEFLPTQRTQIKRLTQRGEYERQTIYEILDLLRTKELCVCDLCEALEATQSKLSFHLKVLKEAKLVRSRQEGRWMYYSLNLPQFVVLEQYLAEYRRFSPIMPSPSCDD